MSLNTNIIQIFLQLKKENVEKALAEDPQTSMTYSLTISRLREITALLGLFWKSVQNEFSDVSQLLELFQSHRSEFQEQALKYHIGNHSLSSVDMFFDVFSSILISENSTIHFVPVIFDLLQFFLENSRRHLIEDYLKCLSQDAISKFANWVQLISSIN